jgi:site-specific recombinase XerD
MREHTPAMTSQNTERNDAAPLIPLADGTPDGLAWWAEQYFRYAVTASPVSQQVQRRDLARFLQFMRAEEGTDRRPAWTPRLSSAFQHHLQSTLTAEGRRAWSDRTIVRMLAHLKTFATWVHTL